MYFVSCLSIFFLFDLSKKQKLKICEMNVLFYITGRNQSVYYLKTKCCSQVSWNVQQFTYLRTSSSTCTSILTWLRTNKNFVFEGKDERRTERQSIKKASQKGCDVCATCVRHKYVKKNKSKQKSYQSIFDRVSTNGMEDEQRMEVTEKK